MRWGSQAPPPISTPILEKSDRAPRDLSIPARPVEPTIRGSSLLPASPPAGAADVHRLVPAGLDPRIHDHPCGFTDTAGDLDPELLDDLAGCEADLAPIDVTFRAVAPGDVWACAWPVPGCAVVRDLPDVRWPDPLDAGVAANPVRVPPADRPSARVARAARGGRCRTGVEGLDRDAADRDGHPTSRCCRNRSSASRSRSTSATLVDSSVRAWAMNSPSFRESGPQCSTAGAGGAGPVATLHHAVPISW